MASAHSKPTLTRSASLMTLQEYASVAGFIDVEKGVEDCRASIVVTAPSSESTTTDSSPSGQKGPTDPKSGSSTDNEEGQKERDVQAMFRPLISNYLPNDRFLLEIKNVSDGTLYTSASIIKGNHIRGVPFEFNKKKFNEKKFLFLDSSGNQVKYIDSITRVQITTDEEEMNEFCLNDVKVHQSCPIHQLRDVTIYVGGVYVGSLSQSDHVMGLHMGPMTLTNFREKVVGLGTTYVGNAKIVEFDLSGRLTIRASANVPDNVWTNMRMQYDLPRLGNADLRIIETVTNQDQYSSSQWTFRFDTIALSEKDFPVLDKFAELTAFQKDERSMQLRMHKLKYKIKDFIDDTMAFDTLTELPDAEKSAVVAECYKFCRFLFVDNIDDFGGVGESVRDIVGFIVAIRLKLSLKHYQEYFRRLGWTHKYDKYYANLFWLRVYFGRDENGSSPEQKHEKQLEEEFYEEANNLVDNFASDLKQSYNEVTQNGARPDTTLSVEEQKKLRQERLPKVMMHFLNAFEKFRAQRETIWNEKIEEEERRENKRLRTG